MKDSEPGYESSEGIRHEERLERGRSRKDDPVNPESAPRGQDEEESRLQEVEAENDLQSPAGAALGHPGIVEGEREGAPLAAAPLRSAEGIQAQPRGDELLCGASLEREGAGSDDWERGAGAGGGAS